MASRSVGWRALSPSFPTQPLTTQQILHPALYKSGKVPRAVSVPSFEKSLGSDWAKLEDDTMGEFGWREILQQFIDKDSAASIAEAGDGDHYIVYVHKPYK